MKVVYKYALDKAATFQLPQGADILHVAVQSGRMQVWASVDPDAPMERRQVYVVGTGEELPPGTSKHINTFLVDSGRYVFHSFEYLS